jgi:hypothetical protein
MKWLRILLWCAASVIVNVGLFRIFCLLDKIDIQPDFELLIGILSPVMTFALLTKEAE